MIAIGNDISYLQVSVNACVRFRNGFQETQSALLVFFRYKIFFQIELLHGFFVRAQMRCIGLCFMQFAGLAGEHQRNFLQAVRLLRDNAREGAFSGYELVFGPETFAVRNQAIRLRRGDAHLEDGACSEEFFHCSIGLKAGIVKLG